MYCASPHSQRFFILKVSLEKFGDAIFIVLFEEEKPDQHKDKDKDKYKDKDKDNEINVFMQRVGVLQCKG